MPYEVSFAQKVEIKDRERYWNDCCIGGDVVLNQLLPIIRESYDGLESNQEDWGWFAWFEKSRVKLAVDVFTDDPESGEFRIHLTSRVARFLFGDKIEDTPELEELRSVVANELTSWGVQNLQVIRVDDRYMELRDAT
jgi:hypothetical protein